MLRISEIFTSIQGETSFSGYPCTFIRLAGCNLECAWCDTAYARNEPGEELGIVELVDAARQSAVPLVSITGGEPLLQSDTLALAEELGAMGFTVMVETNGSLDISPLRPPAIRILDLKPPSSGMSRHMDINNLAKLIPTDEIKCVIADETDYAWACATLGEHAAGFGGTIHFSPVADRLPAERLAEWILRDRLPVRLNLQLHRILWPNRIRRA